jgi:hypothetical protein
MTDGAVVATGTNCLIRNLGRIIECFKAADYGIVGDVFEVLPKFTEEVKKLKGTA